MNRGFPYNYGTWVRDEYVQKKEKKMWMNIIVFLNWAVIVLLAILLVGMILGG